MGSAPVERVHVPVEGRTYGCIPGEHADATIAISQSLVLAV